MIKFRLTKKLYIVPFNKEYTYLANIIVLLLFLALKLTLKIFYIEVAAYFKSPFTTRPCFFELLSKKKLESLK